MNRSLGSRHGRERVRRWLLRWWRAEAAGRGGARGDGVLRLALAPAEALYRIGIGARNRAFDRGMLECERLPVPVVSVGNLAVGGAGKTPVAAWLAAELARRGFAPAMLHGGYAADEPMLHRSWNPDVPVFAERDRVSGGRRAIAEGATAIVLDDGFQHRRLVRDIDLVLVAAETWPRRLRLLPRGPWRETPAALARATLIAVTRRTAARADAADVARIIRAYAPELPAPILLALRPEGWVRADGGADGAPRGGVLAVAGIAWPELFFETAREMGVDIDVVIPYPDHHDYGPADAAAIKQAASGRPIIMTEKDWIKFARPLHPDPPPLEREGEYSPDTQLDPSRVWVLRQRVEVEAGAMTLAAALDGLADRCRERSNAFPPSWGAPRGVYRARVRPSSRAPRSDRPSAEGR